MKKTIISLMLIIPLILVLALFSIGKVASLTFDIPASGINITTQTEDGFLDIDMATYNDDIFITAQVEPKNASNRDYSITVESLEETAEENIKIDEESGKLTLLGVGKAKITATSKDKGFQDSIIANIYSTKIVSIAPSLSDHLNNNIEVTKTSNNTYSTTISGGYYNFSTAIYPETLNDSNIEWSSSDSNVISINPVTGKAKACLSGNATVTATSCDGIKGDIKAVINVTVNKSTTASTLLINGQDDDLISVDKNAKSVQFFIEKTSTTTDTIQILGDNISSYELRPINSSNDKFIATVNFNSVHADEEILTIKYASKTESNILMVSFLDFNFDIVTSYHSSLDETINQKLGTKISYIALAPFDDSTITYVWQVLSGNSVSLATTSKNGFCDITTNTLGETLIKIDAVKDGSTIFSKTKKINVVENILSLEFINNQKTYGIENLYTISNKIIRLDRYMDYKPQLDIRVLTNTGTKLFTQEDLIFKSSDENILKEYPTLTGLKVNILNTGIATMSAEWKYNSYFNSKITTSITLRNVNDAVTVSDYSSLKKATQDGKKIVLQDSIMLGKQNATLTELQSMAYTMPTTYDWQFYTNSNNTRPNVMYLIEFKNDVYGNGYTINADYITQAKDATGNSLLFKGPLDFVSIATASIKAQDNIVFLVRENNVLINNINLLGCSDESLYEEDKFNLSALNNTGTTLEIASSCRLVNSRVSNGRTTLRIFGGKTKNTSPIVASTKDYIAKDDLIKVDISSCILTNAREFIVKIGSNRAVLSQGTSEDTFKQTKLYDGVNNIYDPYDHLNWKDHYFYDNYVTTDVTIKDSMLATSGFFSIGMETHFSGVMLSGYSSINPANWNKLAATSYPSVLHLVGDVKMLDWKDVEKLDSSTLIETTANAQQFLTFDVKSMVKKVQTKQEYADILSTYDNKQYVHGGIAFYGGGYNYSCLDLEHFAGGNTELHRYNANLSILAEGLEQDLENSLYLQGTMLPLAAGEADFQFFMYDKNSYLNYAKQLELMKKGTEYLIKATKVI